MMRTASRAFFISMVVLVASGCASNAEQDRRDREAAERAEALRQTIIDLARQITNPPTTSPTTSYSLKIEPEGALILIGGTGSDARAYRIDIERRTLTPTTLPAD